MIYRNISFHDENVSYLRQKEREAMQFEAEEMACTNPAELPEESRFLHKMNGVKNSNDSSARQIRVYVKMGKQKSEMIMWFRQVSIEGCAELPQSPCCRLPCAVGDYLKRADSYSKWMELRTPIRVLPGRLGCMWKWGNRSPRWLCGFNKSELKGVQSYRRALLSIALCSRQLRCACIISTPYKRPIASCLSLEIGKEWDQI